MTTFAKVYTINGLVVTREEYFEWLEELESSLN